MLQPFILLFLILLASASADEMRTWRNSEGTKSFDARFVDRKDDKVTLLRSDGKELTFETTKLHLDDQHWLDRQHPLAQIPDKNAVFDTLEFGDRRDDVSTKLEASKMVESSIDGVFQGRTGLNGIYRTRQKIGGLYCYLFFNWGKDGNLKDITLRTESKDERDYTTVLQPCWKEMSDLITPLHGQPIQKMKFISHDEIQDGQMLASHLWSIEQGGTVMLGTSNTNGGYQVVVRFTEDKIEPVRTEN